MKIGIPKERRTVETRVAASAESVKKLINLGFEVVVETGAGDTAGLPDAAFEQAGATIAKDAKAALSTADVVAKVAKPLTAGEGELDEVALMKKGAILLAPLAALQPGNDVAAYAEAGITAFALELVPRITRAQSMDILSSQANLAGYQAVIDASAEFGRAMPMMMTAAGTVPPARTLILGAGVAGLQAIATARRLGAVVSAFDVRPAAKEQVESLGATFVEVPSDETASAETAGGYAKEMSEEYKKKQSQLIHDTLKKQDIAICTALIPGKPAPTLITDAMVADMKPGSVIIDLAVETGGNCTLSKPGEVVVTDNGVKIVGHLNVPGRLAQTASALFAQNIVHFLTPLVDKEAKALKIDWEDEIVAAACVARDGKVTNENVPGAEAAPAKKPAARRSAAASTAKKAPAKKAPAKKAPAAAETSKTDAPTPNKEGGDA